MIYCAVGVSVGCLPVAVEQEPAMETFGNLLVIGIPAIIGLIAWAALRRRNTQPILAGCAALAVALAVMTVISIGVYTIQ